MSYPPDTGKHHLHIFQTLIYQIYSVYSSLYIYISNVNVIFVFWHTHLSSLTHTHTHTCGQVCTQMLGAVGMGTLGLSDRTHNYCLPSDEPISTMSSKGLLTRSVWPKKEAQRSQTEETQKGFDSLMSQEQLFCVSAKNNNIQDLWHRSHFIQ